MSRESALSRVGRGELVRRLIEAEDEIARLREQVERRESTKAALMRAFSVPVTQPDHAAFDGDCG